MSTAGKKEEEGGSARVFMGGRAMACKEGEQGMLRRFGCLPYGRDGADDLPSLAAPSLGQGKEGTRTGKERKEGERDVAG